MTVAARVLVLLVAVTILIFIIRLVGQRRLRSKYALLWLTVGLLTVLVAAFPAMSESVAGWFGIEDTTGLMLTLACTLLLFIVIHYSWELSRLESRSRRLAEEVGLLAARLDEAIGPSANNEVQDGPDE